MKADIDATVEYPHPPERVWAALTSSEALAAWLMPNDFVPEVGHGSRSGPGPRRVRRHGPAGRVLELDPPPRMVWSWAGGNIDTTVTFTLEAAGPEPEPGCACTRSASTAWAASSPAGSWPAATRGCSASGCPPALDQQAGASTGPAAVRCAEGWRAYLGIVRRWRHAAILIEPAFNDSNGLPNLEVISVPVSDQDRAKAFYADRSASRWRWTRSFGERSASRWDGAPSARRRHRRSRSGDRRGLAGSRTRCSVSSSSRRSDSPARCAVPAVRPQAPGEPYVTAFYTRTATAWVPLQGRSNTCTDPPANGLGRSS